LRQRLLAAEKQGLKDIERYGAAYAQTVVRQNAPLREAIKAVEADIVTLGEAAGVAAKEFNTYAQAHRTASAAIKEQSGLISDLEKELKQLQNARPFLKTQEDLKANTAEIVRVQGELEKLNEGLRLKKGATGIKTTERAIKSLG